MTTISDDRVMPVQGVVRLSPERWRLLVSRDEYPMFGMFADGRKFQTLEKPVTVGDITFLPATYVPR